MKKSIVLALAVLIVACVTGCVLKQNKINMDQLAEDNNYHYRNKDLGFSLVLPVEFKYFQTQRKETDDYIDLEVYIPTSDRSCQQLVPGYARVITVRIFNDKDWQSILKSLGDNRIFYEIDKKGKNIYTVEFWSEAPFDWQNKWSKDMEEKIKANFNLID